MLNFKFHCDSINIWKCISTSYRCRNTLNSTVILLISGEKRTLSFGFTFKFHCDSINIGVTGILENYKVIFKFHCDSINIIMGKSFTTVYQTLNSTVILLICLCFLQWSVVICPLNSTVILLIWWNDRMYAIHQVYFKFHCDSINITLPALHILLTIHFKFHCDSINILNATILKNPLASLNSTVILLISIKLHKARGKDTFKFHCDSINIASAQSSYLR